VRGIPHCARHLVEAMLLAEDESDPSG
jgi:hypothetical protein